MTRVDFLPGQEMPEHMHPVPVVCFVSERQIPGEHRPRSRPRRSPSAIRPSSAPAQVVHYFRNLSTREPGQLYCAILAGPDDKQLSVMLDK